MASVCLSRFITEHTLSLKSLFQAELKTSSLFQGVWAAFPPAFDHTSLPVHTTHSYCLEINGILFRNVI